MEKISTIIYEILMKLPQREREVQVG